MNATFPIAALRDYAERWGIPVLTEPPSRWVSKGPGPWSIATWHKNPRIFSDDASPSVCRVLWAYLLHELAHVACPVPPDVANEFSDTLGFEMLSIRHLGLSYEEYLEWFSSTWGPIKSSEGILHLEGSMDRTWVQVRPEVRKAVENDAKKLAIRRGLFDATGKPTYRIARLRAASGAKHARPRGSP
jgi:hypothetical protein